MKKIIESLLTVIVIGIVFFFFIGVLAGCSYNASGIFKKYAPKAVMVVTDDTAGSGIIISKTGRVLTCAHLISNEKENIAFITYPDYGIHPATIVKIDRDKDLALLEPDRKADSSYSYVPIIFTKTYIGEPVYSIGNPWEFDWTISNGIISGHRRYTMNGPSIQSTVITNPGNSGGPLFNRKGRLIGLMWGMFSRNEQHSGISFAVPLETILRFIAPRYTIQDIKE